MLNQIILAVFTSEVVINFVKWLIERHDKKKDTPERIMLRALGSDRLEVLLKDWLHSDIRTAAEWEIIENLYQGYIGLGGNGRIHKLYDEAKQVPTTE